MHNLTVSINGSKQVWNTEHRSNISTSHACRHTQIPLRRSGSSSQTMEYSKTESTFLIEKGKRSKEEVLVKGTLLGSPKFRALILLFFLLLAAVSISVGVTLGVLLVKDEDDTIPHVRTFDKAAVATDSDTCSKVGVDVLKRGGSAIDAAVASSFCVGVVNLHSTGIGGGGFLIYYNATNQSSVMIDFREVAANNITAETLERYRDDETSTVQGNAGLDSQ